MITDGQKANGSSFGLSLHLTISFNPPLCITNFIMDMYVLSKQNCLTTCISLMYWITYFSKIELLASI